MVEQILLERVRVLSHDLSAAPQLFSYCYGLQAVEMDTSRIEDFRAPRKTPISQG